MFNPPSKRITVIKNRKVEKIRSRSMKTPNLTHIESLLASSLDKAIEARKKQRRCFKGEDEVKAKDISCKKRLLLTFRRIL